MDKEKIKGQSPNVTQRRYLYEFRKKHQYTLEDVSEMIGMSRNYYEMIEKGRRGQRLSLKTAYKFSTFLSISLQEVYDLEEQYQEVLIND